MTALKEVKISYTALYNQKLHGACNFARAQAAGAGVDALGRAVHDSLYTLNIGLPGPVGVAHGVGYLAAEGNTLATEITFCHIYHSFLKIMYLFLPGTQPIVCAPSGF